MVREAPSSPTRCFVVCPQAVMSLLLSPLWQHTCMKSWCFGGNLLEESSHVWLDSLLVWDLPSALGRNQTEKHVFLWRRQQWPPVVIPLVFCRKVKSCLGGQWKIHEFSGVKASNWVKELLHWTYNSSIKSVLLWLPQWNVWDVACWDPWQRKKLVLLQSGADLQLKHRPKNE